mmetsp:Transcript_42094/g.75942  ORF Transcript_42094/g.75942 Transcript_42094/m.75942 type:complete len:583 (-) Transcript_42094:22-1770(-)
MTMESSFQLHQHPCSQKSTRMHHRQRSQKNRHQTHYYLRPNHLQFCLLLLAPTYVLLSSVLLLHPSINNISSLRSNSNLRFQQRHHHHPMDLLRKASTGFKGSTIVDPEMIILRHQVGLEQKNDSRMSKKRVVFYMDIDNIMLSNMAESMIDGFESHTNDSSNTSKTLQPSTSSQEYQSNINIHSNSKMNRHTDSCKLMAKWQTMSFPTCNSFHEMNIFSSSPTLSYFDPYRQRKDDGLQFYQFPKEDIIDDGQVLLPISETYSSRILGNGWFRHAWEVSDWSHDTTVAIKTLRLERDFLHEYHELHRRDAVAMERLTASPYVMDIYGYCGQSALTELAFLEKGVDNLYRLSVSLRGNDTPYVLKSKLQIAAMTSLGVAHIHNAGLDNDGAERSGNNPPAIAHYDINPRNIIISKSGKPKVNDFNVAEFLTWDPATKSQQRCGFESRLHEPWWRAPEEMILYANITGNKMIEVYPKTMLSEKVDVYSLGNTLFVLLTGMEPRGKEHKAQRFKNVSNIVAHGEYPSFGKYSNSTDPAVEAIRQAILLCLQPDPNIRTSAMEIAKRLLAALDQIKQHPVYKGVT